MRSYYYYFGDAGTRGVCDDGDQLYILERTSAVESGDDRSVEHYYKIDLFAGGRSFTSSGAEVIVRLGIKLAPGDPYQAVAGSIDSSQSLVDLVSPINRGSSAAEHPFALLDALAAGFPVKDESLLQLNAALQIDSTGADQPRSAENERHWLLRNLGTDSIRVHPQSPIGERFVAEAKTAPEKKGGVWRSVESAIQLLYRLSLEPDLVASDYFLDALMIEDEAAATARLQLALQLYKQADPHVNTFEITRRYAELRLEYASLRARQHSTTQKN